MVNPNQPPVGPQGVPPKLPGFKWTTLLWLLLLRPAVGYAAAANLPAQDEGIAG